MSKTDTPESKPGDVDMFGRKLPKRFFKSVSVEKSANGYAVKLDGRPIKTPAKNLLECSQKTVAQAIAQEWEAQAEFIDMDTMYCTKVTNTALDRIAPDPENVIKEMVDYANSDLLCYRALEPESLVQRQNEAWDPVLSWLEKTHGCRLFCIGGLMHKGQQEEALQKFEIILRARSAIMLAALHNMTTLTGSAVLSLGVCDGYVDYHTAWDHAHVDEDWQIDQWGRDEDAIAHRHRRWLEMEKTGKLLELMQRKD